jgi:sugar lactone lactonase YvrE
MKNISTKNLLASFLIFFATSCFIKAQPVIVIQPTNQTVIVGNSSKLSIGVSGTGPFTYQWQINGSNLPPNTTTKIAGYNNDSTFSGDGSKATNSSLSQPSTVAFDASGNLYITDLNNNRVRKINTEGIIATVVGNGVAGFSGDGGFATNAAINQGYGVASDTNGNLFLTDSFNQRIRKVSTNGIIETVVGNGSVGFSGDGGAATNASLRYPQGIAFDNNGNLFIADSLNNRIRKIDSSGTISTVAGNGIQNFSGDGGKATNASLFSPNAIAFDKDGNMFIADSGNGRIRKINLNGTISTVAGKGPTAYDIPPFAGDGGTAVNAQFCEPMSLATDSAGNLIIDDYCNSRIRKVSTNGIVSTIAGNGVFNLNLINGVAGTNFGLFYPRSIAVDAFDNVYIADSGNNGIVQIGRSSESPSLSFSKASLTDAGNYSVVVTSSSGSITSSFAILNVVEVTKIIDQPLSRTNFASSTAAFMVNASGISLTYQWLKNSAPISGAVLPAFTLSNVQDQHAGVYSVIVNGLAGSVTSSPAVLTIDDTLFIASSPQNQTVNLGGNATFTTEVTSLFQAM